MEGERMTKIRRNTRNSSRILDILAANINRRDRSNIFDNGRDLLRAREQCNHGEWGPWLKEEIDYSEDTAARYMKAAELASRFRTVRKLQVPPTTIYALCDLNNASVPKAIKKLQTAMKEGRVTAARGKELVEGCRPQRYGTEIVRTLTGYKVPVYQQTPTGVKVKLVGEARAKAEAEALEITETKAEPEAENVVPFHSAPKIAPSDYEFVRNPEMASAWVEDFDRAVHTLDQLRSKSLTTFDMTRTTPNTIKSVADFLVDVCSHLNKHEAS
jgi:hypothetical protein